jgi:hypothetical protein
LAIPASRSERSPADFFSAAEINISFAASNVVAISARWIWIAWWAEIGLPKALRCCA